MVGDLVYLIDILVTDVLYECPSCRMCAPKEEITNNELPPILNAVQTPPPQEKRTWEPVCVVCEFAMEVGQR